MPQVPPARQVPVLQVLPAQQGRPAVPHAAQVEVPFRHTRLELEQVDPAQHGCPCPPHATHDEVKVDVEVWQTAPAAQ